MKIQSMSIVVPSTKCINDCKFCVSKMHKEHYPNRITDRRYDFASAFAEYKQKMEFARDNGCNTLMLTGECEPQQYREFLKLFGIMNKELQNPFKNIQIQTTGTLLDRKYLEFLQNHVGVNVICVSIASFDSKENAEICGMKYPVDLIRFCMLVKDMGFTLRLSINCLENTLPSLVKVSDASNIPTMDIMFKLIKQIYNPDQITFRDMYQDGSGSEVAEWVFYHKMHPMVFNKIKAHIKEHGVFLNTLEYGFDRYSINGMSTVVDTDCMSKDKKEEIKYLILRPDCKLYTKWDDKGSILF